MFCTQLYIACATDNAVHPAEQPAVQPAGQFWGTDWMCETYCKLMACIGATSYNPKIGGLRRNFLSLDSMAIKNNLSQMRVPRTVYL
jgi:hypothetical protein